MQLPREQEEINTVKIKYKRRDVERERERELGL